MNSFFPTDASPSRYVKLRGGANRFRILDDPITGWTLWVNGGEGGKSSKVLRLTKDQFSKQELAAGDKRENGETDFRETAMVPVWNYDERAVQVWEISQFSILKFLDELGAHVGEYDIEVNKTGAGKEKTRYSASAGERSPIPSEAWDAWMEVQETGFDITELLRGGDPFSPKAEEIGLAHLAGSLEVPDEDEEDL